MVTLGVSGEPLTILIKERKREKKCRVTHFFTIHNDYNNYLYEQLE